MESFRRGNMYGTVLEREIFGIIFERENILDHFCEEK